ncbi:hypothetical protein MTO96_021998 [Rhipicephalus appendiculatus]
MAYILTDTTTTACLTIPYRSTRTITILTQASTIRHRPTLAPSATSIMPDHRHQTHYRRSFKRRDNSIQPIITSILQCPCKQPTNVKTVPYMVCRIIQLPMNPLIMPASTFVPKEQSPSMPQQVFNNIGNVVGRVIHPVVSLLNGAPGWNSPSTSGAHSPSAHHHNPPHVFTVLNHTAHHGQSHNTRPHHNRRNFTTPNVGVVQKKPAGQGDVNHQPVCPSSGLATTTSSPTPAVTTAATPTTTVGMSILKSSLCGQGPAPAVPALRAYPFTVPDATATWSDNPTAIPKEPTSDLYQEITTAGNTVLPTTLADVSVSIPRDQTRATVSTSAAATLLAESSTTAPVPTSNDPAATTYSPASDTVSTQSPVPSTTSVVPTTVRSPTSLKVTQTALPAATDTSTQPPAVESTSVVHEDTPDAASSGTVFFTTTSHRFV